MNIFTMHRGDDKIYELIVTNKQTGLPVDITGCEPPTGWIKLTVRETPISAIFVQKTFALTDPTNGKAEVAIDASDTSGLTNTRHEYCWDVEILKTTGKKETLCSGKLIVEAEVTY